MLNATSAGGYAQTVSAQAQSGDTVDHSWADATVEIDVRKYKYVAQYLDEVGVDAPQPRGGAIERRLLEIGRAVGRNDAVDQLVEEAGDMALPFLFGWQAQAVARRVHGETVRDQRTVRAIAAHPVAGLAGIGGDQLTLAFGRHAFQPDRQQLQFPRRLFQPRVDDARAIAVEIEESARQQGEREHVHRQDARRQAQPARPAHRQRRAITLRRIGSRRHRGCRSH